MSHPDEYGINRSRPNGEDLEVGIADVMAAKAGAEIDGVIDHIARYIRWLPLRSAMTMAEEIVNLPDYKAPASKIELAMILNEWAFSKGDD